MTLARLIAASPGRAEVPEVPEVRVVRRFSMRYKQLNMIEHEQMIRGFFP